MKKKSKFKKILLWTVVIVMAVVLIGGAAIAIFFPKEKIKAMAIAQISEAVGREVTIEGISVSFWGGIGAYLENITIANPDNFHDDKMLQAEALDIKLQFWPLLKKEVVIDKLILVGPSINLQKLANGTVNYQFSLTDSTVSPDMAKQVESMSDESKLAASAVSFDNLEIKRGRLIYINDSSNMKIEAITIDMQTSVKTERPNIFLAMGNIVVDSLLIQMDTTNYPVIKTDIKYDTEFDYTNGLLSIKESDLTLNDILFKLNGSIGNLYDMADAEFQMKSETTSFDKLSSFLTDEQKKMMADYDIKTDWRSEMSLSYNVNHSDSLVYNGKIELGDMKLNSGMFPSEIDFSPSSLEFNNYQATLDIPSGEYLGNPFKGSARVVNFDNLVIDGKLEGALKLASMEIFLPNPKTFDLTGDMIYSFNYKYQIDKPEATILTGYIHLKNGTYKAEALPENIDQLNARLNIDTRNIIFEQFDVKFESSDISLTGTLKNAFPYFIPGYEEKSTKPFLDFKMTSNRLDVDKLFPEVAPGEGASFENVPADSIPPFILPDINGQGTGNIGTLVYSQVDFTNIKSNIKIEDRKIKVTDANASVYTGKVTGETEIDLNDFENPIYSGNFTATQIEANDFLSRFTKFGGHLYGKANLEGAFSASGLEPELIMKSLNMNGKSMFKEGKLVNFDIVNNFAQQFNFSAPTEEKIRDLVNSFAIKDGRIAFDAMKFISEVGDWAIDGSVGFDGTLDYKCKVLLTEKYANQIIKKLGSDLIGSLLKNDTNERIEVPFKLSGTYQKPTITIEQAFWDGLQKKFMNQQKDKLEGKVGDALKKLFGN